MLTKSVSIIFRLFALLLANPAVSWGQMQLRDICHVKGQEANTLHGLGLVVGLKGTGDSELKPTHRALATMMKLMGNPVGTGPTGEEMLKELSSARNVALVFVTATVPGAGARQGSTLNCRVSAVSAKSLAGGQLLMTALLGPVPGSDKVYAFASGPVHLENTETPATATIFNGCRLEENFHHVFTDNDKITLVIDRNHAGFQTAQEVADLINTQSELLGSGSDDPFIAKAKDQVNVEVKIPSHYKEDPVLFLSQILKLRVFNTEAEARVVVNERTGSVIIGGNVEIGPVVVNHKNMVIEAGTPAAQFVPLDPNDQKNVKLKALVDALNAVKVPPGDVIDIIKGIDRNGKLYAKLIIE